MKKILTFALVLLAASAVTFVACSKDKNDSGSTTLRVRMTDNPVAAEEVNIDIQQVRVNYNDDSTEWADLNTYAGVYNLLGLQNGVDTLLAVGTIPTNYVKQIRFVLGSNNTIKVAGVTYPLTVPSGSESGLKLIVNKRVSTSLDSLLIDFDAALSIHQTGNGSYQLKPVLKLK
jgi:hypothetical protein